MDREDIIRMARNAGLTEVVSLSDSRLIAFERFAALIASRVATAAKAEEREACAKVCDDKSIHCEKKAQEAIEVGEHDEVSAIRSTAWQISVCASAIRARGKA